MTYREPSSREGASEFRIALRRQVPSGLVGPLPKEQGLWAETVEGWNPWLAGSPRCAYCGVFAGHHWSCHEFPLELPDVASGMTLELSKALELNAKRRAHPDERIRKMAEKQARSSANPYERMSRAREPEIVHAATGELADGILHLADVELIRKKRVDTEPALGSEEYAFVDGEYVMVTR